MGEGLREELIGTYQRLFVGYSGGLDSQVLLHRLHHLDLPITAVYINHQLSPQALNWQQHCQQFCELNAIPFIALTVDAKPAPGESPEAAAREARYAAFETLLEPGDALLLAQHQDDQAETILLQLLRGSGPKGLAAMARSSALGAGVLLRPFLDITRSELEIYAREQALTWIEDESNQSQRYDRNYLRSVVSPLLRARWPQFAKTLARSAQLCAESLELFAALAKLDLEAVWGREVGCLSLQKLKTLTPARRHNVLRYWLEQQDFEMPSQKQLQQLERDFFQAAPDAEPELCWPGVEIRRYQDDLYAMLPLEAFDASRIILLEGDLSLRFRQGGEVACLDERQGSRCLKKIFQDWQLPPWLRTRVPLLYQNDNLIAIYNPNTKEFRFCSPLPLTGEGTI